MSYWVYENWRAESKAVIHVGTCRFCNEGAGTGRNTRGERNGKWHGGFASLHQAKVAASKTGRPFRQCRCIPSDTEASTLALSATPHPTSSAEAGRKSETLRELAEIGFKSAGFWRSDPATKSGVRFTLDTSKNDRVVYAFVVDEVVGYIGICDSSATTLSDRMLRYQNMVGAGTNKRIIGLIKAALSADRSVWIYALKPEPGPVHLNLAVDYVKGLELPLIDRLEPLWNKRR